MDYSYLDKNDKFQNMHIYMQVNFLMPIVSLQTHQLSSVKSSDCRLSKKLRHFRKSCACLRWCICFRCLCNIDTCQARQIEENKISNSKSDGVKSNCGPRSVTHRKSCNCKKPTSICTSNEASIYTTTLIHVSNSVTKESLKGL